jgi:hypothetical protein
MVLLFVGIAALPLASCGDASDSDDDRITTGTISKAKAEADAGHPPRLFDGFEDSAIASFRLPGDYGRGLSVGAAVKLLTTSARHKN